MQWREVCDGIPAYERFLTVDELEDSAERLREQFPALVDLVEIGQSRAGHPIRALKIGAGPRRAVLFGCPHPNEPVGAMMLEYLSWRLAQDDELREKLGYTWYLVKTIDPDGTRLNEGWFRGPFTLFNYARHYYRPAGFEQVEWTFPIRYKTLVWEKPIPETQALMRLIDLARPGFMYSLHNAGFGGVYWYVSRPCPPLYERFHQIVREQGLPLSLGEPEMPFAKKYAQAIFEMPGTRDTYDYYEKYAGKDPATIISAGTSSVDYAREVAGSFVLVCEVPYFYDPRIEDTSPADISRREAVLASIEIDEKARSYVENIFTRIRDQLTRPSPFVTALTNFLRHGRDGLEAKRRWAKSDPELERPATVAEKFDNLQVTRFYRLLLLGLLHRAIEYQLAGSSEDQRTASPEDGLVASGCGAAGQLARVREEVYRELGERAAELESQLNWRPIPIRKLVAVQLASALEAARYAAEGGER